MLPSLIEAFKPDQDCVMRWRRQGGGFICELPRRRRPWRARTVAEVMRICQAFEASEVSCTHQLPARSVALQSLHSPISQHEAASIDTARVDLGPGQGRSASQSEARKSRQ
jgi:hypothetical protein